MDETYISSTAAGLFSHEPEGLLTSYRCMPYMITPGQGTDLLMTNVRPALILYELLITLWREVALVWQRKFCVASCFIMWIRWTLMLEFVTLVPYFLLRDISCTPDIRILDIMIVFGYIQTAAFCGLRVFALTGRKYVWSSICFVFALAPAIIEVYILSTASIPEGFRGFEGALPQGACNATKRPTAMGVKLAYTVASRLPVIIAEAIALAITWCKTYRQLRMRGSAALRLSMCLFQDGNMYFVALVLLNLLQLLIYLEPTLTPIVDFLETLPPILIARFLFDIREETMRQTGEVSFVEKFATDVSSLVFAERDAQDRSDDTNSTGR